MANVEKYVDPDATGAGDGTSWTDAYTSLSAWDSAEATDLVTAGDTHTVWCRSGSGTKDNSPVSISSDWVTGDSNRLYIKAADGNQAGGDHRASKDGFDSAKYTLSLQSNANLMGISTLYIEIHGLQIEAATTSSYKNLIEYDPTSNGECILEGCYFSAGGTTGNRIVGVAGGYQAGLNRLVKIRNCIFTGFNGGDSAGKGVWGTISYTWTIQHCVFYDNATGIDSGNGTTGVTNCAVFNNTDDFSGSGFTIDHCASDDGDGTNSVSPSGSDWTNEFADPANGDFTLLNTGNLYEGGTTISGGPSTDIDGDSWGATPSIGADEYSAGATQSIVPHIMLAHNQFTGGL